MRTLRQARFLARLVLAWFALSIGVAAASPLIKQPQPSELVCSAAGILKLAVKSESGHGQPSVHLFDCPLCLHAGVPPSFAQPGAKPLHPPGDAPRLVLAAHRASVAGAPLPARGPPGGI